MTSTDPQKSSETRIRVKFYTQQEKYRVPSDPIFLPINLKRLGLSTVINHLLSHGNNLHKIILLQLTN
jgi:ribosome biogenesis protein YTM1